MCVVLSSFLSLSPTTSVSVSQLRCRHINIAYLARLMNTVHLHDKIKKNENFIQFLTYMQGLRIKDDVADRTMDLVATEFQSGEDF